MAQAAVRLSPEIGPACLYQRCEPHGGLFIPLPEIE